MIGNQTVQHGVIGAGFAQRGGVMRIRLNMNPPPPAFIKRKDYLMNDRVICANINVKSGLHMFECTVEHDIFKILSIRNKHNMCLNYFAAGA